MEPHYQSPLSPEQRYAVLQLNNLLLEKISPRVEELLSQTSYTEEEMEELKKLQQIIDRFVPIAAVVQNLLMDNLVKVSTDIFFRARELAEQGNEQAREAYEGLKPLYAAMKKEELDGNRN